MIHEPAYPQPQAALVTHGPSVLCSRRRHLILAAVSMALLYLATTTDLWWPASDSALYLGLARSLSEGHGYRFNGSVNRVVMPGFPVILAGIHVLFGEGFRGPNLFIALCALATITLVYMVIAQKANHATALVVALATGCSYMFYHNAHRILTDMPFTALFWATLYTCLRHQRGSLYGLIPTALLTAVSIAVRAPGVLLLGLLCVGIVFDRSATAHLGRRLLAGAVVGTVVVITTGTFYLLTRSPAASAPDYFAGVNWSLSRGPANTLADLGIGLNRLPGALSELFLSQDVPIPCGVTILLLAIIGGISCWRRGNRLIPTVVLLYVTALACFASEPKMIRPRYLLPLHGLLVFLTIEGLFSSIAWIYRRKSILPHRVMFGRVAAIFLSIVIVANAPRLLRDAVYYTYLSYTPRYYATIRSGRYEEAFPVANIINKSCGIDSSFAVGRNSVAILHFLSQRKAQPLPAVDRTTVEDAENLLAFITSQSGLDAVVIDISNASQAFLSPLKNSLEDMADWSMAYDGSRYIMYCRTR